MVVTVYQSTSCRNLEFIDRETCAVLKKSPLLCHSRNSDGDACAINGRFAQDNQISNEVCLVNLLTLAYQV